MPKDSNNQELCVYPMKDGTCNQILDHPLHNSAGDIDEHEFIDEEGMVKLLWERMNPPSDEAKSIADICMFMIDGYGYCKKDPTHIVHQGMGVSPVEHDFQEIPSVKPIGAEPDDAGEYETEILSKRNINYIARRSGKSKDELELMRRTLIAQGKGGTKIRYRVIPPKAPQGDI